MLFFKAPHAKHGGLSTEGIHIANAVANQSAAAHPVDHKQLCSHYLITGTRVHGQMRPSTFSYPVSPTSLLTATHRPAFLGKEECLRFCHLQTAAAIRCLQPSCSTWEKGSMSTASIHTHSVTSVATLGWLHSYFCPF